MLKVDYNNIWYSFFKATKKDIKEYLINILTKKGIIIKDLEIKMTYTNWEHNNYFIVFNNNNSNINLTYDVGKNNIITE